MNTETAAPEMVQMGHNPSPAAVALLDSIWHDGRLLKSRPAPAKGPAAMVLWCQLSGKHPFFTSALLDITPADADLIKEAQAAGIVRALRIEAAAARESLNAATARAANPDDDWDREDALWCIERAKETLAMAAEWGVRL